MIHTKKFTLTAFLTILIFFSYAQKPVVYYFPKLD